MQSSSECSWILAFHMSIDKVGDGTNDLGLKNLNKRTTWLGWGVDGVGEHRKKWLEKRMAFQGQLETWDRGNSHEPTRMTQASISSNSGYVSWTGHLPWLDKWLPHFSPERLHPVADGNWCRDPQPSIRLSSGNPTKEKKDYWSQRDQGLHKETHRNN